MRLHPTPLVLAAAGGRPGAAASATTTSEAGARHAAATRRPPPPATSRARRPRRPSRAAAVDERLPPRPRATRAPPDAAIAPLRPRLWRSVPSRVPRTTRASRLGRALPGRAERPLGLSERRLARPRAALARTSPAGRALVRAAARSLRGQPVEWDVWNEPDDEDFWTGTREQFFRVYAVAARALADELGRAPWWSAGPAPRSRGPRVARAASCDTAGAHALPGRASSPGTRTSQPTQPIAGARERPARAARATASTALPRRSGCAGSQVNESVGPADQYRPGEIRRLPPAHGGAAAPTRRRARAGPTSQGRTTARTGRSRACSRPTAGRAAPGGRYRAYARGRGRRACASELGRCRRGGARQPAHRHGRAPRCCWPATTAPTRRRRRSTVRAARCTASAARSAGARTARCVDAAAACPDTGERPLAAPRPCRGPALVAVERGDVTPARSGRWASHAGADRDRRAAGRGAQSPPAA